MANIVTTIVRAPKHVLDYMYDDNKRVNFNQVVLNPNDGYVYPVHTTIIRIDERWRIQNWGCISNAYEVERRADNELKFETSWYHPYRVMVELSVSFPDEVIRVRYADEDIGSNFAHYHLLDGEAIWRQGFYGAHEEAERFCIRVSENKTREEYYKELDE